MRSRWSPRSRRSTPPRAAVHSSARRAPAASADPLDVSSGLHPVDQRLEPAGRTGAVWTPVHRLALRLDDVNATQWALLRHLERLRPLRVWQHRSDDLRDDVTGALDDHVVALADVLAVDVFLVVQRCLRHRDTADLDRLELCPWVQRPGTADADVDLVQFGLRRHRSPLEGARPAWSVVQRAEAALLVEGVDLDHDPVDLVVELDAPFLPGTAGRGDRLDGLVPLRVRIRAEPVRAQPLERLPVTVRGQTLTVAEPMDPDRQRAFGGDRGVLKP